MQAQEAARRLADLERRLRQAGVEDATDQAERDLDAGLEHPLPLNLMAYRHEQAGRFDQAMALLERAQALAPDDVFVLNSIGLLLARQDRRAEALRMFDAALRLQPGFPQAHYGKAQSLEAIGEEDAAAAHYRRAIALNPRYGEAVASLGLLLARRGELDAARPCVERALALERGQPLAVIAQAMIDLAKADFETARSGLGDLLRDPRLDPADRPFALSLLGDALDAQDRCAEAFAAYGEGKASAARLHAGRFAAGGEGERAFVRRLIDAFPAAHSAPAGEPDGPAATEPAHVFLLGFPRSGTTLLEQVLASHPEIETLDERDALAAAEAALLRPPGGLARLAQLDEAELDHWRRDYWRSVETTGRRRAGKVLVDKLPLHSIRLPLISRLFPRARIIFALRDPRDVVLSCFRRSFRVNAAMYEFVSLDGAARFYDAVMSLASLACDRLDLEVAEIRYEDLVVDFEPQVRRLCAFVGVAWDPAMADFAAAARSRVIRTPSAAQVRKGLYASGREQWRRYADQMAPVLPVLAPWVERFGYQGAGG